jgi:hypothetical protein
VTSLMRSGHSRSLSARVCNDATLWRVIPSAEIYFRLGDANGRYNCKPLICKENGTPCISVSCFQLSFEIASPTHVFDVSLPSSFAGVPSETPSHLLTLHLPCSFARVSNHHRCKIVSIYSLSLSNSKFTKPRAKAGYLPGQFGV